MKKTLSPIAPGIVAALSAAQASAAVLNFDDLGPGDFFSTRANAEYAGFRFGDTSAATWFWNDAVPTVSPDVPASGTTWLGLLPGNNPTPAIGSAVDFVFEGASFARFEFISYRLYRHGVEVSSSATSPCLLGAAHAVCASGYSGRLDSVVIVSNPALPDIYFAMDDFTYRPVSPIPEPSSYGLMACSLAALGMASRRRQQAR
jgi:hypothetical protein